MEHLSYPNESDEYRTARNALLDAEMDLRRQLESVAQMRRALPPGGTIKEDYGASSIRFRKVAAISSRSSVTRRHDPRREGLTRAIRS